MSAVRFKASSPAGVITVLSTCTGLSALLLSGATQWGRAVWGGIIVFFSAVPIIWHLARLHKLTLHTLDQIAWALMLCHVVFVARVRDPHILADSGFLSREIAIEVGVWMVLGAYAVWRLMLDQDRITNLRGTGARLSLILWVLAIASATYAASPAITLAWGCKLAVILALCVIMFDPGDRVGSMARFITASYWGLLLILIQFIVLGLLSPGAAYGQSPITGFFRLGGYLLPSTQLSTVTGLLIVISLAGLMGRLPLPLLRTTLLGSVALMIASVGRGGMLAAAVASLIILALHRKLKLGVAIGALVALGMLMIPGLAEESWAFLSRSQSDAQLASLTGRTELWEAALNLIRAKPILGWGYVSGSRITFLSYFRGWPAIHTHNVFLEILVTLGIAGLTVLVLLLGHCFRITGSVLRRLGGTASASVLWNQALLLLGILVMLCVDGMFTAGFSGAPRFETTLLLGIVFAADQISTGLRMGDHHVTLSQAA